MGCRTLLVVESLSENRDRFNRVWQDDAPRLLLYARRHVGLDDAHDVVAETFAVAWRRWSDVPDPALPWLISTARNCIRNVHRGSRRRAALFDRFALLEAVATYDPEESMARRQDALARLTGLSESHREALLLVSWDGLSIEEAAAASGTRPGTFRVRLHRARRALEPRSPDTAARTVEEMS